MADKKKAVGYRRRIAVRILLILVLSLGVIPFFLLAGTGVGILMDGGKSDRADALEACEYDYYNGEYAGLLNTLELYGETGGEFDRYWEMGKAYEAYQKWKLYDAAAKLEDTEEGKAREYRTEAGKYEEVVRDCYESSTDSENRRILKNLMDGMETAGKDP